MSIAQYLTKFALGVTPEGLLSPEKGGTGTTTGGGGGGTAPTVTSIVYTGDDTATNIAGGSTVTLNGTNFNVGVNVLMGTTPVASVTRVSSTQLTFIAPANTAGSYILYVVNTDGGTATSIPGIQYSGVPSWTTSAGSFGTIDSATSFSTTVAATGDTPVTYSISTGSLPAGLSINSSTGVISGTTPSLSSPTTYNFTVRASDSQNQDTDRAFSITIEAQTTYSVSPAIPSINEGSPLTLNVSGTRITNGTYYWTVDSNVADFATSSGSFTITSNVGSFTVTPTADTTTEGSETFTVSIRSGSISGTVLATSSSITINDSSTTPAVIPAGQAIYTTPGTYSWTAPAEITSVCVVCVGGGGGGKRVIFEKPGDDDEYYWAGGGGALAWKNNITVVPGQNYQVTVGAGGDRLSVDPTGHGGFSSFATFCKATGGKAATSSNIGSYSAGPLGGFVETGDGGGAGGNCGDYGGGAAGGYNPGGGGAGGYSGAGGKGGNGAAINYGYAVAGSSGNGGGGGGGATGANTFNQGAYYGAGGGGVGIYGEGASGAGGNYASPSDLGGRGGSGGTNGDYAVFGSGAGGQYGGGAGMDKVGGVGAVRIIWGTGRAFPSTNTA